MWNVGTILASMIFRKEPFFYGNSRFDQVRRIARVLGTKGLLNYVEKYELETAGPQDVDTIEYFEKRPWQSFFNEDNRRHADDEQAVDLLDKLLQWDHQVWQAAIATHSMSLEASTYMTFVGSLDRSTSSRSSLF